MTHGEYGFINLPAMALAVFTTKLLSLMDVLCPFCQMCEQRIVMKNDCAYAVVDIAPVSPGHGLIIPIRHVSRLEELNTHEWQSAGELLQRMNDII